MSDSEGEESVLIRLQTPKKEYIGKTDQPDILLSDMTVKLATEEITAKNYSQDAVEADTNSRNISHQNGSSIASVDQKFIERPNRFPF